MITAPHTADWQLTKTYGRPYTGGQRLCRSCTSLRTAKNSLKCDGSHVLLGENRYLFQLSCQHTSICPSG